MELIILRHGTAEEFSADGDAGRALVPEGHEQARRAGALLKAAGIKPDLVLTSPLVRARETAADFCEALGMEEPVVQSWLASGMRAAEALAELRAFAHFQRIAIVGHEPDLSSLIETLLGTPAPSIEMKKGAIAGIALSDSGHRGRLRFLIPPKLAGR
jgi:phosphohistidine phosphatase